MTCLLKFALVLSQCLFQNWFDHFQVLEEITAHPYFGIIENNDKHTSSSAQRQVSGSCILAGSQTQALIATLRLGPSCLEQSSGGKGGLWQGRSKQGGREGLGV